METTCRSCKYWQSIQKNIDLGYCRRYAPRPSAVSPLGETGNLDSIWPRTAPSDWCGEWLEKEALEKQ